MTTPILLLTMGSFLYAPGTASESLPDAHLMHAVLSEAPVELSATAWQVGARALIMEDRNRGLMEGNLRYGAPLDPAELLRLGELRRGVEVCEESLSAWDRCLEDPERGMALFGPATETGEGTLTVQVLFAQRLPGTESARSLLSIQVMEYTLVRIGAEDGLEVTASRILVRS